MLKTSSECCTPKSDSTDIKHGRSRRSLMKLASLTALSFLPGHAARASSGKIKEKTNSLETRKSLCGWDPTREDAPKILDISHSLTQDELQRHKRFIREAIELSKRAEAHCNHPFGALLVLPPTETEAQDNFKIILKGENRVFTDNDHTQHAETRLVSDANKSAHITNEMMSRAILYTSAEPCAMCCGAIFWSGIRSVVYAAPHNSFGSSSFPVPSREVFKFAANQPVTVIGPVLASESIPVVDGYFQHTWKKVKEACRISNKL